VSTTTAAAAAKMQPSVTRSVVCVSVCLLDITAGMLTRPAGHKAEARKSEDEAQKFFSRPRPDTLENNSVCMSMKTKILAFRT